MFCNTVFFFCSPLRQPILFCRYKDRLFFI
nr:MAG TPA: hypothetical protein [Caudoviricetes sp.]